MALPKRSAPPVPGLDRNNTSFPVELTARLRELYAGQSTIAEGTTLRARSARVLKYYQFLVREYLLDPDFGVGAARPAASRGLLVYHQMGLGKTWLALSVVLGALDAPPRTRRQVVLLAPKSLLGNFRSSLRGVLRQLYPEDSGPEAEARYAKTLRAVHLVTMNAHNMPDQILRATLVAEQARAMRKAVARKTDTRSTSRVLDDVLLVVDEAHNFFRGVINSAAPESNARRLYQMIMEARDPRLVFLTGTPASKNAFEVVPCFNMLAGADLLPPLYENFTRLYIDAAARRVRNRGRFANRILGLVSYAGYGGRTAEDTARQMEEMGFPRQKPLRIVRVEMGGDQYRQYLLARDKEEAESRGPGGGGRPGEGAPRPSANLALPGSERGGGSTYYVRSRGLSTFAPPREQVSGEAPTAPKYITGEKTRDLPDSVFTASSSPKVAAMVANINDSPGPVLVYSQFVDNGLDVVARFLRLAGYEQFAPAPAKKTTGGKPGPRPEENIPARLGPAGLRVCLDSSPQRTKTPAALRTHDRSEWRGVFLAELYMLTRRLPRPDAPAVVVYAGAAGPHLPLLAALFPNIELHVYSPAEVKPGPRIHVHQQAFSASTAREWGTGGCDFFVGDRLDWARQVRPAGAALLPFRPTGPRFAPGELIWRCWGMPDAAHAWLIAAPGDLARTAKYNLSRFNAVSSAHRASARRYEIPDSLAGTLPDNWDGAAEAQIWRLYLAARGAADPDAIGTEAELVGMLSDAVGDHKFGGAEPADILDQFTGLTAAELKAAREVASKLHEWPTTGAPLFLATDIQKIPRAAIPYRNIRDSGPMPHRALNRYRSHQAQLLAQVHFLASFASPEESFTVLSADMPSPFLLRLFPKAEFFTMTDPKTFGASDAAEWGPGGGERQQNGCDFLITRGTMAQQKRWARIVAPARASMLRFRPPSSAPYTSLPGQIMWPCWGPIAGLETLLIVTDSQAAEVPYDPEAYRAACAMHNMINRPLQRFQRPKGPHIGDLRSVTGYDDSWDSTAEVHIWQHYLRKFSADHPQQTAAEFMRVDNVKLPRPGPEPLTGLAAAAQHPPPKTTGGAENSPENLPDTPENSPDTPENSPDTPENSPENTPEQPNSPPVENLPNLPETSPDAPENSSDTPEKPAISAENSRGDSVEPAAQKLSDEQQKTPDLPPKALRFAVISGEVPAETREAIKAAWNSPANIRGEIIRVILISKTGTEGLDLKYGRQVHILEPYWDKALEDQVTARFVRLGSHALLPAEEREVEPFLYIAGPHRETLDGMPMEARERPPVLPGLQLEPGTTIDEVFHQRAEQNAMLNKDMRGVLQESSIECLLQQQVPELRQRAPAQCRVCRPTGARLFHASPDEDAKLPDPCEQLTESAVEAEPVPGRDGFFFRRDRGAALGVVFYRWDRDMDAHVVVDESDPLFVELLGSV